MSTYSRTISIIITLVLSVTALCARAAEPVELTELETVTIKNNVLGEGRFKHFADRLIKQGFTLNERTPGITAKGPVEIVIFSFKSKETKRINSGKVLSALTEKGFRPAAVSEVLSIDKVSNEAAVERPVVSLGTLFRNDEGTTVGLVGHFPHTTNKSGEMGVQIVLNLQSTLDSDVYLVGAVKVSDK